MKLRDKYQALRDLVLEIQKKKYHEPDSDWYEYCAGCGHSPYNYPQHKKGCLVVKVARVLRETV